MKKLLLIFCVVSCSLVFGQTYQVSTIAGTGTGGYSNGTALNAQFQDPSGVATVHDSVLYIADTYNHVIRKLNLNTNVVTTIAGTGIQGYQDGPGLSAQFNTPGQLTYSNGILYVSDNFNHMIRKIDLATNNVTTIAGSGLQGHQDGSAATAQFNLPGTLVVAPNGDLFIADTYNHCIRKISSGQVTTVAGIPGSAGFINGSASTAKFNYPRSLALSANGDLYIAEINNNVIRKLSGGMVTTFAGTGVAGGTNGSISSATFYAPVGLSFTPSNSHLYVVDGTCRVRSISMAANTVSTIAGMSTTGYVDGPGSTAKFNYPQAISYDVHGYLFVADRFNHVIRKIIVPEVEVGINEETTANLHFSVFPNPGNGRFTISFTDKKSSGIINVYNAEGKIMNEIKFTDGKDLQFQMTDTPPGIYFVNIITKENNVTERIIITN